jgi:GT2 family glycosyltransferase
MKVNLLPRAQSIEADNGIGRVLHAQRRYLPAYGIELTEGEADLYVGHTQQFDLPRLDVLHAHGLYWIGDLDSGEYGQYNLKANNAIIEAARRARTITVPSQWVSMPFKRDMRIEPAVIGHGIDLADWSIGKPQGYALWAKNRAIDVCRPDAAYELARRGVEVLTTFAPEGRARIDHLQVIGRQDQEQMQQFLMGADVYLATVKETFGIQTLEAMACGVPVIGWAYGGTAEIVTSGHDGILVKPGDYDALYEAYQQAIEQRASLGAHARETAARYDWPAIMQQYADLYRRVLGEIQHEKRGVSVVITNYNYGRYVDRAVESVLSQTQPADEIIVVDDGSTDDSLDQLARFRDSIKVITQDNQGVAAARTTGIEAATQAHIVLLDADDQITDRFIETLHPALLSDRGLGIAYTGLLAVDDAGHVIATDFPPEFDWEKQATVSNPPSCCIPSCCMFRRDMWLRAGPHKQEYAPGEDAEFWTRGLSVGFTASKVTAEKMFVYRVHANSATRKMPYKAIDDRLPWMRDKRYPLAAPSRFAPYIRSYSDPKVTIVAHVTRETSAELPNLIDSILGQTMREWELILWGNIDSEYIRYPFVRYAATQAKALDRAGAALVLLLEASDMLTNSALEDMLIAHIQSGGRYIYPDTLTRRGVVTEQPDYVQTIGRDLPHQPAALIPIEWVRSVGTWQSWRELYAALAVAGHCGQRLGRALVICEERSQPLTARDAKRIKKLEGVEMTCCGGDSGAAILAAKQALAGMLSEPVEVGKVRMEYIGDNVGAISFFGSQGAEYRGGNNDFERFADVFAADVDRLVSTGKWRQIHIAVKAPRVTLEERAGQTATATPAPAPVAMATPIDLPEEIEITAEDRAVNEMIEQSRKATKKARK